MAYVYGDVELFTVLCSKPADFVHLNLILIYVYRGCIYLHLCSSTEHSLQSLHEVFHLGREGCVLEEGRQKMEIGFQQDL